MVHTEGMQYGDVWFDMKHVPHMNLYQPQVSFPPPLGAGGGLISNFEQLVRGVWKPETNELLRMS